MAIHQSSKRDMSLVHPIKCGFGYAFLIESVQGLFLIDSGSPGQENRVLAKMGALGRSDLKLIWITHAHYDHYGSASALRKNTGALIGIHQKEVDFISKGRSPIGTTRSYGFIYLFAQNILMRAGPLDRTCPDFSCEDGESLSEFGLDAVILHTPGHTPGHTCVILEKDIAFCGDLLGGFPKLGLQSFLATNWEQLPKSLKKLRLSRPKYLYLGHKPQPVPGCALENI